MPLLLIEPALPDNPRGSRIRLSTGRPAHWLTHNQVGTASGGGRIERETLIAASLERVWSLVAQPGFWVADKASLPGTVAKEGESMVAKNAEHGDFPVRVEKVEPPTYLAYRWTSAFPGEELREDNSTLVEFR